MPIRAHFFADPRSFHTNRGKHLRPIPKEGDELCANAPRSCWPNLLWTIGLTKCCKGSVAPLALGNYVSQLPLNEIQLSLNFDLRAKSKFNFQIEKVFLL